MRLQVVEALAPAEREACMALRRAVFCGEQGVTEEEEFDGRDPDARHLLAVIDGAPAGTLRLRRAGTVAKIERVCVAPSRRRTGVGGALVRAALRLAMEDGATEARLGAQTSALPFYETLGFAAFGPEYLDARIPHRDMARRLP
jgi:ElaA protein